MDKKMLIITIVLVAVVAGSASFYGGLKFAEAKKPAGQFGNFQGQRGQGAGNAATGNAAMRRGNGQGGGFLNGEILSIDSTSVTIKSPTGGSKIAFFSTSTEISKFTAGTISDLAAGANVMITGKANLDGSIIAQSIQIRPASSSIPGALTVPKK